MKPRSEPAAVVDGLVDAFMADRFGDAVHASSEIVIGESFAFKRCVT
jgi:hypothetical protein